MDIVPLRADEAAVRRFVADLWLPHHRDLAAAVDRHALADLPEEELVDAETEFRLDRLSDDGFATWVAVRDAPDGDGSERADGAGRADDAVDRADGDPGGTAIAATDAPLVGFVTCETDRAPRVFDRPDRLVVGDLYVDAEHRGTGVARDLIDRVRERAEETACAELALDVDADNDRALAFYRKLGFEPYRHRMAVGTDDL
ncbi:GNAT family N-acetyltransferase [Halobaculum sp. EA56]|uniref:GNAT family N-acetyltransferase n=1 Tax=Halobaculum sp. EA56 TaxID=3421648 RepID=UPI003EC04F35